MSDKFAMTPEEKSDVNSIFWRAMTVSANLTYVRLQGPAFGWVMMKYLRGIYKDDDEYYAALKRNMMYFNTNPVFVPFIANIVATMEKENSEHPIEGIDESVNGIKVGLMGPLAGLGDSFFTNTMRVIAAGVGIGFASQGSILGAILFLLIYHVPYYLVRYWGGVIGHKIGASYIGKAQEGGLLSSVIKGCSILGLMMVGAMTYLNVSFGLTASIDFSGSTLVIQDVFDQILPGLLPLALVWLCVYLLRKKNVSVTVLLIGLLVLSIVLGVFGIAGVASA